MRLLLKLGISNNNIILDDNTSRQKGCSENKLDTHDSQTENNSQNDGLSLGTLFPIAIHSEIETN